MVDRRSERLVTLLLNTYNREVCQLSRYLPNPWHIEGWLTHNHKVNFIARRPRHRDYVDHIDEKFDR